MIWLKLFFVFFYCTDFITLGQSTKLSKIKLTTRSGFSCGGWALFAQICSLNFCCEEQIVSNPGQGFSGGDIIIKDLKRCNNFTMPIPYGNDFQIRFTSYEETTVTYFLWITWPFPKVVVTFYQRLRNEFQPSDWLTQQVNQLEAWCLAGNGWNWFLYLR